jgi:hypothetical protein
MAMVPSAFPDARSGARPRPRECVLHSSNFTGGGNRANCTKTGGVKKRATADGRVIVGLSHAIEGGGRDGSPLMLWAVEPPQAPWDEPLATGNGPNGPRHSERSEESLLSEPRG